MDKKILIIFLIAIVAFSISCVSAADSNEIVMNSSDAVSISEDVSVDDGAFANPVTSEDSQVVGDPSSDGVWVATTGDDTNDGSQANPVASVSKAVDLAQSGATIHIKEGTYNQGKIGLNKSLSFVGEGKVILNSNGANVFECLENDCTLEFTNLVFTGVSSASGSSCGLRVGGNGNLKVINCTFRDISAKFGAMQLYTTGVADIINSTIKDVTCGVTRGSIVYNSGTGKYNFDNISIINPKLSDSVTGAAVHLRTVFYLDNKEATVTLTNSRITGASGSMMSLIENKGTLTISNTVISNNVIGKTESGINGQYLLYLGNSNFVTALNMTNCIIENNTFGNADTSALAYIFKNSIVNLTYSSIMNNGFSKNLNIASGVTPTVNLDYNWWGTNTYTGDNVNKWVVMSTPETTIDAESGKAIDVSVNFNHYTDASGSIQDLAQSISGINVDFSAVSGTLSKNNVASVDGIATVTYTTTTNDKITAKSGSQSLTIDVVAKQAAADIWVATTGSDDNDGSQASPVATITKAIELAGDGYIIHIADGNYVIDKTLSISKSLTLEGNANTVINGNASRIMEVTADATVVLTNLSFTNGKAVFAGAILNEGKLTISNSNFYSNKATGSSGTIITNKNKLNINNSKFYQNSAARGVVFNQNDAVLVIDNSEFYNNDMTSFSNSYGIVYTTSANATISNTVFRNNAVKWGGAIYATKSSDATIGIVNIINSTFESNSANTGQGGALFVSGGECIVKESMFINNKANPGKYTGGQGGAIYTSLNGNVSVTDSVFKNNQAKLGAVLYLNGGSNSIISYSVLLNNTAEGDYAISNGESASGVATVNYNWWGTNSPKNLVPSTVTLNNWVIMSADPTTVTDAEIGDVKTISVNFNKYSSFGAIKDLSKPLSAIDVEFSAVNGTLTSNLVSTVDGVASVTYTVNGNDQITAKSGSQTLTIEVVAKLPVTDVWVSSTGSDANDGSQDSPVATIAKAIELVAEGYTIHVGEGTYIANSLTIAKSFAMIGSGKVIIDGNASKIMNINENTIVNFTNVAFTNALNNYGGVMQSKGTVNLNNVSIYKNTQKSGSTPTVSSIYNTGVMTIINSNIYENDGYGLIFNSGNLDIINTTISSNNVAKGTTYAFLYIDGGVVNVINSTISDNAARLAGIWLNKGTLNVNNATFENNVVTVGNGGAIHIESDSSTATIKDSKFIGNKANKDGGAIYNKGTLNIETSIFDANAASNGNAGYHGDDIYNSGILTLHYSALLGKGTNKLIYNEGREPSANAQYNWWGTNSNPSTLVGAGLDYDDEPCDDVDVSNWVVMSVDPVSIENANVGDEKTLTVNFNHYNANGVIKELTKAIPSVAVSFEAVNGTLAGNIISTVDGVASVTYTVHGNDQITVTSGSQTLTIDVSAKQIVTDVWVSASGSDANDGSQANPVATIAKAVELVKPGYTIHVMDGTYTVSDLAINFNVAIIGENEVTFTGDTKTMFTVANGIAFNLTNLNITGINRGTSNYGVIYNKGGSVYLNKINAYSNTANQGAVVYSDKGSVNIVDSEFRANSGTVGVIYANAANVVMNNSKIYDSTFSGNGVIYGSGSSVIDLSNVDISNNKMTGNALIGLAGTELTISDSYVHNNTLSSGAIFYGASSDNVLNIRYSIFGDNTVNKGFAYCLLGTFKADISDSIIISNEGTTFDALIGTISGTIDNNWWGTNSPKTGKLIPSKWVVLTATSNFTESLKAGEVIGITAGLNTLRDAAGNNYTLGDTDIFDGWNVEINGEKATVKDGKATVLYTLTSGENVIPVKADSETLTLTYNVGSSTTNIVTNDTFFNFFDNAGTLLESITYDTLIFKGEFSDLGVNVVYVPRAITINGDNAVLRNIAIMCEQGTVLNNLTLNATNYVADTDGALIYAIGSDVTVNNITIDYNATDGSNNAIAVYASGADNFKLVNSTITFTGNNVNGKVFAQGIKIAKSNNAVVDSNIITTSCPLVDVDYSHWGSIDTDLVFAIGVEKSENVKIINNVVDNSAWTKGNGANFPTFDAFIAHTANNLLIKNNTISHTDLITPKGTSSYIYALDFYESNSVVVEDNRVLLNTTGGKEGAGAAYAVQVTGPYNNFVVRGNNLTTVSNGPNLAVYSQNYYGTTEITVENNWINVTGFAGPADFALVSGMEFQDTVAKAYNNTIYVQNVNEYNDNNNIAGITYVQSTSGSHKFDIQNNTIYSEGKYAVLIKSAENSQIIGNTLYAHELKGDDAAIFKSGTNNIIKDNKPMTFVSDIIIDVNNVWIGKEAVIGVTLNSTATGSVNITVGGKTYTVSLTDGKATLKVSDLVAGVNTVVVNYYGDDNFKYSTNSTTFKVLDGVVTNETFFVYFDEDGLLREEVPFDELVFKGEFSNLVNLISIEKPLKITSDNAVLRNIAFAVLSDNVVLNGLTLISNVSCADNGGTLILVAGNNVNITDMNISYIIKESVDAVAINANGVSNLNVVNSNIFFEACPKDDTLTACAINMEGVSNSFIDGNNITAVLPYLFASNYDYTYFMMGVNTVNPIRMRECTNVTFSKNNVNTTANDGSASFPTLQCMFIVGSKDCVIDGNNFSMIDTVIPAGTSNYLYGINIGYNKNLMISNNDFKMSTAGGKDAAGTAYAIQGVECEVSMIGNNITSVSNGPNLGIYFASMTGGTSELYIANNLINVTGLASASGSWALVSGIEVQNGNAKIYNNTIYTYNVGAYNPGNYMYGISYAQYMYGDRSFDVRNNTVYVDGHYAVSFLNANNCNVTDNFLITRDLAGDAAVEIKAGKNNVVENNYPRSSDLIFNITSEEPGKILINVTIDKKATGNMTIKVNGEEYTVTIVDGSASLTLDNLDNGTYFIETAYGGNTFITESSNSTFFNLGLIESSIVLNVSDIKVGQDAIITANITDGATGTVTFFVNGNSYLVFIENGTATLKVSDLTPGDYSVFAQYNGDKQYTISSNSTVFNVAKLSSKVAINVNNIKVGQDATIRLTLPNVNSGVVSVIVNGKTYNVNIVNTKGTLTVSNLANGTYTVIAKFEGNDMYAASEANTTFSVSKIASTTTVSVSDINATQDAVINIAVPGIASGVVSVTVGDAIYSVAVVDGKGSLTVSGLAAGSYDVVAKFAETDMYLASEANATFSVSKLASTITVAVGDIDATHDAIVNVEVPNVDLGSVTVTIGKTSYDVAIIDGKGTLNVPNLDGATYNVVAKFNGNDKYLASENTTKFTVSKIASNIVVYVKDIDVDGLLVFDAFVSQGATGSVFFRKGLTEVGNHIIDGRATVRWGYMSTAGTYTFEVRYAGDGKFLPFYSTVSANVNKIVSSVSVNVNDINVGENAIIYATVSPSGVAGDVKLTIDNKTYTEKISDGVVKFTIPNLTAGKHEISVTYAGNYKYLSSTSSTSINVSRFDSTTHVSVNDINAGENAVINIAVSNGTSGVASVRVGDMSYNVAVVDGKGTLTLSNLIAKSYDVVVKFEGNDVYLPSQDATKFTVSKIVSAINITVSDINVGDDAVIDIAVSNVTSGVISVRVDNTVYNVVIVDGKGTLVVSNLAAGYYTVVAKFAENDIYLASMDTVRFTVSKLASTITVNVSNINVGEDAVISIAVPEVTSGVASVTVNGKSYNVAVVDGKGTLVVSNLAAGYYTVVAKFAENDIYLASMDTVRFTVSKLASTITVNVSNINVGEDAVISIAVPEVTSGVASVTVNGKSYNVAVVDGKGSLIVSGLAAGSYDVVAKFAETDMYLASENSAKFTVSKLVISSMDVDVKDIKVGDDAVISVALPEDATGNVIVNVNGKNYTAVVKYGVASVTVSNLANGTYSVSVFYNGDDTYMPMENSTKFTVSKVSDYNMTVDIADIIKGENATITVTVPKDGTGSVVVTINGTDYKGTVTNGTAKVIIPGLDEGTYKVVTFYTGDAKYDSMIVNGTITVNKNTKTTLTMDDVVKYFKGAQNLTAKLVDAFGNPIANATVYFTVNGKVYAKTTDKNGTASMGIGLVPNEYKVNAVFNGTKDYDKATANATVTIKNTVFGNDTTLYFCNGTKYVAKFLDSNGKALANTTVKFNINGVFYTRVTDENGTASLGIRLNPKSYVITAYNPATGEERANNITVLPRLTAQDLSMKYLDGSTFNATLVDGQGKALAGANITFNVNGVFYHKTTNANGVASLNIRLMAGEYIITSMYDNCWASNKITISA